MPRLRARAAAFGVAGAAAAAKALAGSAWATAAGTRMLQMSPASLFSSSLQHSSVLRCLVQTLSGWHHQAVDVQGTLRPQGRHTSLVVAKADTTYSPLHDNVPVLTSQVESGHANMA